MLSFGLHNKQRPDAQSRYIARVQGKKAFCAQQKYKVGAGGMLGRAGAHSFNMKPERTVCQGCRVVVRLSSFDHPNSDLPALIRGHPFNHTVQVLLPLPEAAETALDSACAEAVTAFDAVATAVSASQYYAAHVASAALVEEDFIKARSSELALAFMQGVEKL